MDVLEVYVARHCFGYEEAFRVGSEIIQSLPGLQVKVRILDQIIEGDLPETVATPSYLLNGRLLFLGNPSLKELVAKISSLSRDNGGSYE